MSDNMHDLDGWVKISCADSDGLRANRRPVSSLTDPEGTYGPGVVYTEWATEDGRPVLRDYRWSDLSRVCEHYVPDIAKAREEYEKARATFAPRRKP